MTTNTRIGNLLTLLLVGAVGACTSSASGGTGGSTGSGGAATGTGGTTSTGSGGSAGGASGSVVCNPQNNTTNLAPSAGIACPPAASSGVIADFTKNPDAGVPDGGLPPRFGDDSTVLSGGGSTFANTPGSVVTSDTSAGDWHIKADVANYAGFSLYFDDTPNKQNNMPCNMVDATGFTGISFDIWGDTAGQPITMAMGIVDDTPTASWFQSIGVTFTAGSPLPAGSCIPNANGMQYYHPGCGDPTAPAITVTGTQSAPQTVALKWTDFINGACMPNVIPNQIVSVSWQFNWVPSTTAPYTADIHIDNLKFITN
jgi:hypothetical protein